MCESASLWRRPFWPTAQRPKWRRSCRRWASPSTSRSSPRISSKPPTPRRPDLDRPDGPTGTTGRRSVSLLSCCRVDHRESADPGLRSLRPPRSPKVEHSPERRGSPGGHYGPKGTGDAHRGEAGTGSDDEAGDGLLDRRSHFIRRLVRLRELPLDEPMDGCLKISLGGCGLQRRSLDVPEDVSERSHTLVATDVPDSVPREVTYCRHEEGEREALEPPPFLVAKATAEHFAVQWVRRQHPALPGSERKIVVRVHDDPRPDEAGWEALSEDPIALIDCGPAPSMLSDLLGHRQRPTHPLDPVAPLRKLQRKRVERRCPADLRLRGKNRVHRRRGNPGRGLNTDSEGEGLPQYRAALPGRLPTRAMIRVEGFAGVRRSCRPGLSAVETGLEDHHLVEDAADLQPTANRCHRPPSE